MRCPCCGREASLWVTARDNRGISPDEFKYYRCAGCGLVFLHPLPGDLEPFYAGGYQTIPESLEAVRKLAAKERYRLQPLAHRRGGDLLEIGPWIGLFSINAQDAGFNVEAIEMSAAACEFLREKAGIEVTHTNDVEAALLAMKKNYDVIALWHSLEHLREPWRVLELAAKRLKPGGTLLLAIPNIDSMQSVALRGEWLHLDAPRHLYFWPPDALATLLNGFGLQTIAMDTTDRLSSALSRNAWEFYIWSKMRRWRGVRTVVSKTLAPVCSSFTQRHGRGAGITAVFKQQGSSRQSL